VQGADVAAGHEAVGGGGRGDGGGGAGISEGGDVLPGEPATDRSGTGGGTVQGDGGGHGGREIRQVGGGMGRLLHRVQGGGRGGGACVGELSEGGFGGVAARTVRVAVGGEGDV